MQYLDFTATDHAGAKSLFEPIALLFALERTEGPRHLLQDVKAMLDGAEILDPVQRFAAKRRAQDSVEGRAGTPELASAILNELLYRPWDQDAEEGLESLPFAARVQLAKGTALLAAARVKTITRNRILPALISDATALESLRTQLDASNLILVDPPAPEEVVPAA